MVVIGAFRQVVSMRSMQPRAKLPDRGIRLASGSGVSGHYLPDAGRREAHGPATRPPAFHYPPSEGTWRFPPWGAGRGSQPPLNAA
jgi:hypothetical protein